MNIDISAFTDASIAGVSIVFVVVGLTQWIKGFIAEESRYRTTAVRGASMLIGLVFGWGYMVSANGTPATFAQYFGNTVYGIGLGLVASGLYDSGKSLVESVFAKFLPRE